MKHSDRHVIAELRRSPAKTGVLGVALLVATWSWSGVLFGTEKPDDGMANQGSSQVSSSTFPSTIGEPTPSGQAQPSVYSYSQALDRLRAWSKPLGLHAENVDDYTMLFGNEQKEDISASSDPFSPQGMAEVELELTGTVLFQNTSYAFLGGIRVQVGDHFGRYRVESIRSREVDLLEGSERITLQMLSSNPMGNSPPRPK